MKLNIEIDLNDFYAENFNYDSDLGVSPSSSLSDEVVDVIKHEVKRAISKQVGDDVKKAVTDYYQDHASKTISAIVDHEISKFVAEGKVKKSGYSYELVSVEDKMREIFDNAHSNGSATRHMESMGRMFGDECKKRYDMHFASNIVKGLESQGLLKAGVFEAITDDSKD